MIIPISMKNVLSYPHFVQSNVPTHYLPKFLPLYSWRFYGNEYTIISIRKSCTNPFKIHWGSFSLQPPLTLSMLPALIYNNTKRMGFKFPREFQEDVDVSIWSSLKQLEPKQKCQATNNWLVSRNTDWSFFEQHGLLPCFCFRKVNFNDVF